MVIGVAGMPSTNIAPSGPDTPWPVEVFNSKVKGWIERLGSVWIEGQITQMSPPGKWNMVFMTLRDTTANSSVQLLVPTKLVTSLPLRLSSGDQVVVCGRPRYYEVRGSFSLEVRDLRPVGEGELLARIERRRAQLAAEGLFDPARKKPLPVLPVCIGLITGRASAAESDVLKTARARWPEVRFEVRNTAVQGNLAVGQIIAALGELDAIDDVDVIIIARGGGSVEDLLPFNDESLQRAVAAAHTPVVSAIGHEPDHPILDDAADVRARTPTDAAKIVVPDAAEHRLAVSDAHNRCAAALRSWVSRNEEYLRYVSSRPVLANPMGPLEQHTRDVTIAAESMRSRVTNLLAAETTMVAGLRARVTTLGPAATLARGYSITQVIPRDGSQPTVVTSVADVEPGQQLRIRVGDGSVGAAAISVTSAP